MNIIAALFTLAIGGLGKRINENLGDLARCNAPRSRGFSSVLPGEGAAFGALPTPATAPEVYAEWLQAYGPTPKPQAYGHYLAWLAHHASRAGVAGALAVNLPA